MKPTLRKTTDFSRFEHCYVTFGTQHNKTYKHVLMQTYFIFQASDGLLSLLGLSTQKHHIHF